MNAAISDVATTRLLYHQRVDKLFVRNTDEPNIDRVRLQPSADVDAIAADLLDAAVDVHRSLGPGFLEAIYEEALCVELTLRSIPFVRQSNAQVHYKGRIVGQARIDLLVADRLIVELKAIEQIAPIHLAQAMSYLRATRLPLALLVNFNAQVLLRGVRRIVLSPSQTFPSPGDPGAPGG